MGTGGSIRASSLEWLSYLCAALTLLFVVSFCHEIGTAVMELHSSTMRRQRIMKHVLLSNRSFSFAERPSCFDPHRV